MKTWLVGILFGGFFGFVIATLSFLLGLSKYGESTHHPFIRTVQIILLIVFGWIAWKAEGVETLVGYILGSFYITRLILLPHKTKID